MSFRVGQYNVFANYLADNFRPWLWYGFKGVSEANTELEERQLRLWGKGRSKLQEKFWCLMKKYAKLFDTHFPYNLERIVKYSTKSPSRALIHELHAAIEAFFYRNNLTSPIGKSDTTPYLFDRSNDELKLWNEVTKYVKLNVPEDDKIWDKLDKLRRELAEEKDTNEVRHILDTFNEHLRDYMGSDTELSFRIRDLAALMSPNDRDLSEIIKYQKAFLWEHRAPEMIKQTIALDCDVWGFQELDKLDYFRTNLRHTLKLAVYKYRKVEAAHDGAAIFYNPNTFKIHHWNGNPAIGSVRYSAEAKISREKDIKLREGASLMLNNVLIPEESSSQDDEKLVVVPAWTFTEKIQRRTKAYYDERIGVFVILQHRKSKTNFLFVCTHLYHTQNNTRHEIVRAIEMEQLLEALNRFKVRFKCPEIATILLGDLNDVPNLKSFGRSGMSKVYSTLIKHNYKDVFVDDPAPTSITLSRSVQVDYIWTYNLRHWSCKPDRKMPIRCICIGEDEKMTLLPPGVNCGATVCPPMPAVDLNGLERQPAIPSDHIPVCTTFIADSTSKRQHSLTGVSWSGTILSHQSAGVKSREDEETTCACTSSSCLMV